MNNPSNEVINLSLTKKQCNTIIEALLFSASTDICSDWQPENMKTAVDINATLISLVAIKTTVNTKNRLTNTLLKKSSWN